MTKYTDEPRMRDRLIYQRRVSAMPRYHVGQRQIEDGPDAVDYFARAQLETTFSDAALARVVQLMWSHGISNARLEPGDSPGSTDYIVIECGLNHPPMPGEVYGERRWQVVVYWADNVLAKGECTSDDVAIQAWTVDREGNEDSHLSYVLVPLGLDPTNDTVLDVCEAIVEYIYANAIPLAEVTGF